MKRWASAFAWVALGGAAVWAADGAPEPEPAYEPTSSYTVDAIDGWPVKISAKLIAEPELYEQVRDKVTLELKEVNSVLPAPAVKRLQAYPIWIELKTKGAAQFHPDRGWLLANGFNPEKAGNLELSDAKFYLNEPDYRRTNILLHELSHAYHFHVVGHGNLDVIRAYDRAKQSGRLDKVLHDGGKEIRHYGLNNQFEYFAEMSEAVFWVNDFYPFVRAEYQQFDPDAAAALLKLWQEPPERPAPKSANAEPGSSGDAAQTDKAGAPRAAPMAQTPQ